MSKREYSLFFLTIFLCSYLSASNELSNTEIAGNVKRSHRLREYGKVKPCDARNIPRPGGIARANKSLQFYASYLLWAIYQDGQNIALSNIADSGIGNLSKGNTIIPYSPVRSGLKVYAGKSLYYDDWEALIGYTWIGNVNPLSTRSFHIDNIYYCPWLREDHLDLAEIATSYSNQFNRIDSKLYRHLALAQSFCFTPWIGVLGAWEDCYLETDIEVQETITDFHLFFMRNKQYWWCIGPYSGIEISYNFWKPLSLFASTGGSINLSKYSVILNQQRAELSDPDEKTTTQDMGSFTWEVEPMLEATLGLNVDVKIADVLFFFKAAWECQTWFSHNGFIIPPYNTGIYGNYSMQGLTTTIGVVF